MGRARRLDDRAGGGLSLAHGMALGAAPAGRTETPVDAAVSTPKRPQTPPMDALVDAPASASVQRRRSDRVAARQRRGGTDVHAASSA